MSCAIWQDRVALFAGGDLEEAEAVAVERHISECAACSVLAAELRWELDGLREVHAEPLVAAHYAAVRERVLAELEKPPQRRVAWAWAAGLAVAAAGAWVVWLVVRPNALPAPETPRVVAVVPKVERLVPRGLRSNRFVENGTPGTGRKAGMTPGSAGLTARATALAEKAGPPAIQEQKPAAAEVAALQPAPHPAVEDSPVRMVQLATDDPNVVIYWLFEEKGEER